MIVPSGPPGSYCRLCLSETNVEVLLAVPDGFVQPNQRLVDLIKRYVEIGLYPSIDSPCGICSTCRMMLEEFELFRERCLRCDYVLTGKERHVPFECTECPSKFRFKVEFERHWKSNHEQFFMCDLCPAGFATQAMLDLHRVQYHLANACVGLHCTFCPRVFADNNQLQFHIQLLHTVAATEEFVHPPAKKSRPAKKSKASNPVQQDPENPDRPYECRACRIRFSFIGSLTRHLAEKHKNLPRATNKKKTTPIISEVQSIPEQAEMPLMVFHEPDPSSSVVVINTDPTVMEIKNHQIPIETDLGQAYEQAQVMEESEHPVIHPFVIALTRLDPNLIAPVPYSEIPLGKFYHALQRQTEPIAGDLMDDEIMKNYPSYTKKAIKKVQCDICFLEFASKRHLDRHKTTIHEGNFHTCPECFRQFPDKSSLDRHSYLHTNDFPFVCDECPLGFVRLGLLNKHKEKFHYPGAPKQELFYCPYCSRPFNAKAQIRSHIMFLHGDRSDDVYSLSY